MTETKMKKPHHLPKINDATWVHPKAFGQSFSPRAPLPVEPYNPKPVAFRDLDKGSTQFVVNRKTPGFTKIENYTSEPYNGKKDFDFRGLDTSAEPFVVPALRAKHRYQDMAEIVLGAGGSAARSPRPVYVPGKEVVAHGPGEAATKIKVPPKDKCMKLFDQLDPNGNKMLSLAELDKGVVELWPNLDNKPAIMRAYKAADKDESGYVVRDEFMFFLQYLEYYNNLWHDFDEMDTGDDRRVTKEELIKFAPKLKVKDPEKAFTEMDQNGGGIVLFDEFCYWMAKNKSDHGSEKKEYIKEESKKPSPPKKPRKVDESAKRPAPKAATAISVPPKEKCMELFDRMDPNGNGMLSLAEMDKAVVELWPKLDNKPAIMRAYKAADRNGEGFITKGEFEFFLRFLTYYNNLWNDFDAMDTGDDRRVTKDEFVKFAPKLKIDNPGQAFDEMDANGGGFVLFDEFCTWMAQNKSEWGATHVEHPEETKSEKKPTKIDIDESAKAPPPSAATKITLPPKEKVDELFDRLDPNGNKMLSLAELDKGVVELWPNLDNKPAIMRAYRAADRNGEGFVTRSEFPYFLRFLTYYNNLWADFDAIDDSDDRRVSKEEFMAAAGKFGIDDPETAFIEMDTNGGGTILFDEFCAWKAKKDSPPEADGADVIADTA